MTFTETIRGGNVGFVIALVVLILSIVLMFLGGDLTSFQLLGLIAALALSRLL